MPRTNNLNRNRPAPAPKSRPTSYNGYGVTTLPAHPKEDPEAEETLPAYTGSNQLTLPVHSKDSKAAELAAATEPGSDQDVFTFRGAYNAPPPPVEDAETKAVRVAQQLVDATVFARQVAAETRDKFDVANQLLANEPCPYHQQAANDAWARHVTAAQQADRTYLDSLEACKVADKIKAENAPVPAFVGDYLAPPNLEERTEEEWDRIDAEYVRRQEQALDAYALAVQDVAKKEEAYAILRLQAENEEMDRVAAMDAEEEADEDVIEIDGVFYGRAW